MIKIIKQFFKGSKKYSILILMSQLILVLSGILMANTYSTFDVGTYTVFWGLSMFFKPFSSLKYELSFLTSNKHNEKYSILTVCLLLNLLLSPIGFIIELFDYNISGLILFFSFFLIGLKNILSTYFNTFNINKIGLYFLVDNLFFLFGILFFNDINLITLRTVSLALSSFIFIFNSHIKIKLDLSILKKYVHYPKFSIPGNGLVVFQRETIPVILEFFLSTEIIGLFGIYDKLVRAPIRFITQITKNIIFKNISDKKDPFQLINSLKKFNLVATFSYIILVGILYIASEFIFKEEVSQYRYFILILLVPSVLRLNFSQFSSIFVLKENQKLFFKWSIIGVLMLLASLFFMSENYLKSIITVAVYQTLIYLIGVLMIFNKYKKNENS